MIHWISIGFLTFLIQYFWIIFFIEYLSLYALILTCILLFTIHFILIRGSFLILILFSLSQQILTPVLLNFILQTRLNLIELFWNSLAGFGSCLPIYLWLHSILLLHRLRCILSGLCLERLSILVRVSRLRSTFLSFLLRSWWNGQGNAASSVFSHSILRICILYLIFILVHVFILFSIFLSLQLLLKVCTSIIIQVSCLILKVLLWRLIGNHFALFWSSASLPSLTSGQCLTSASDHW